MVHQFLYVRNCFKQVFLLTFLYPSSDKSLTWTCQGTSAESVNNRVRKTPECLDLSEAEVKIHQD